TKFDGELKKTVLRYIHRTLAEAIPMLRDREVFTMGNDGYPAKNPVDVIDDVARVVFHFTRNDNFTLYEPLLYLRGQEMNLISKGDKDILCDDPAWVLLKGEVFTFDVPVDGKKLRPFLKKPRIAIPRSSERQYFSKFVTQIIERYTVKARGFEILPVQEAPKFLFYVDGSQQGTISMALKVQYGPHVLPVAGNSQFKAIFEADGDRYTFYKIHRETALENDVQNLLERLAGNGSLISWDLMTRQEGLRWLAENIPTLKEAGIQVVQVNTEKKLNFDQPRIEITTKEEGDWFDIHAVVHIGGFKIPFVRFKTHILKGKRDYVLPDGTVAILPDSWFSDFRHLVEIAEEKEGEVMSIRKYQAVVLEMQHAGTNGFRQKVEAMRGASVVKAVNTPDGLHAQLREYQKQGYDWLGFLKEYNLGGILADDMGLGKTLQALSLLQHEKETGNNGPSLIVMPTSLVYNWMAEARKFTPTLKILIHTGMNRAKDPHVFSAYDLILTTYGIVRQDRKMLMEFPFNYIILDESQMIK
ncbi:MAG: SNF2-related protein, partial [Bacteroidota bacterium]